MNARGALVIDPGTGDPVRRPGFTLNVASVLNITTQRHRYAVRGDEGMGYFCKLDDKVELGPCPTADEAATLAKRYAGIWERAS